MPARPSGYRAGQPQHRVEDVAGSVVERGVRIVLIKVTHHSVHIAPRLSRNRAAGGVGERRIVIVHQAGIGGVAGRGAQLNAHRLQAVIVIVGFRCTQPVPAQPFRSVLKAPKGV